MPRSALIGQLMMLPFIEGPRHHRKQTRDGWQQGHSFQGREGSKT
jgi:hypothetical protein